jgi:hypothetical protein
MAAPLTSVDRTSPGVSGALAFFLERYGDAAAEAVWLASLAMLERAIRDAREGPGRWRLNPSGELRRLRRDVAGALLMARVAVELQDATQVRFDELDRDLRDAARDIAHARRREQTAEATRTRLLNAAARREGRELTDAERWPWLYPPA